MNFRTNYLNLGSFYFFYWGALACLSPVLGLYYEQLHFTGNQMGILYSLPYASMFIWSLLLGFLLDINSYLKTFIRIEMIGLLVVILFFSQARSFGELTLVVTFFSIFLAPIEPLADKLVIDWLGKTPEDYGMIRLGGSLAWGAMSLIATGIVKAIGFGFMFWGFDIFMILCLLVTVFLPNRKLPCTRSSGQRRPRLWLNGPATIFLCFSFLFGVGEAINNNFLYLHLKFLNIDLGVMGLFIGAGILGELIIFPAYKILVKYMARGKFLLYTFFLSGLRLIILSLALPFPLLLLSQFMGGIAFGLIWIGGAIFMAESYPDELGATAQVLRSSIQLGLAGITGSFVGGFIYENFGSSLLFLGSGIVTLFLAVILLVWICPRMNSLAENEIREKIFIDAE